MVRHRHTQHGAAGLEGLAAKACVHCIHEFPMHTLENMPTSRAHEQIHLSAAREQLAPCLIESEPLK